MGRIKVNLNSQLLHRELQHIEKFDNFIDWQQSNIYMSGPHLVRTAFLKTYC